MTTGGIVLIGRGGELDRLTARVEATARGHGGLVLVAGEPGIGKSSLAAAAADAAGTHGAGVRWGRCRETEGPPDPAERLAG